MPCSNFTRGWLALALAVCAACSNPSTKAADDSLVSGGKTLDSQSNVPSGPCVPCVVDSDCGGARCVQHDGDWVCAAECGSEGAVGTCATSTTCASATTAEGGSVQVCVPPAGTCTATTVDADATSDIDYCPWDPPTTPGCCVCTGSNCQSNGCFGGWYCQRETCKCHSPSQAPACVTGADTDAVGSTLPIRLDFTLDKLDFAIVGDTRPPVKDGTKYYPTPIVAKIWQEVAKEVPTVPFAVTTGDYVFASAYGSQGALQLDLYLTAQAHFARPVWHALGNHECTGATASNCGPGGKDGITELYQSYLDKMVTPMGIGQPYYSIWYTGAQVQGGTESPWTAKFVFIAANAWDYPQAAWLAKEMAKPSTYTFVMRHESSMATQAPGVKPSQNIIVQYPYTLLIVGHAHTFQYFEGKREVIVGNGGAPLTANINYGYVIARQRPDGAMQFTAFDYMSHAVFQSFALKPDGSKASIP